MLGIAATRGKQVAIVIVCAAWLATLGSGPARGACANEAFRTGPGSGLPDCRAYELVSPAEKDGSDVMLDTGRILAMEHDPSGLPMALMFPSLGGFADPQGSGNAFDYLSQRTLVPGTQGWATHAVTPVQQTMSFQSNGNAQEALYLGDPSADFTRAIFRAWSPLTAAPEVADLPNLYVRTDLRTAGPGAYELLSSAFTTLASGTNTFRKLPKHAGASADFSHIVFESLYGLTADAPSSTSVPKAYLSVDGAVRYVAILPAAEGGGPAPRSIFGQGAGAGPGSAFTPHVVSQDGSRVFFTVPTSNNASSGRLYLRVDQGTADTADDVSMQLNASEATTPGSAQPASYWGASDDGTRAFFTTNEALTDDAPVGNSAKLYMYDATKPAADPQNLKFLSVDAEPSDVYRSVLGTLGISADGSHVYFVQRGQIVAGERVLDDDVGIYAWSEQDGVRFVGQVVDEFDLNDLVGGTNHSYTALPQLGALVTPDGRHLLFSVHQSPTPGGFDHGDCPGGGGSLISGKTGCAELYIYDAVDGRAPACVSCGAEPPKTGAFYQFRRATANASTTWHLNRPLTADGEHVFFTTGEALLSRDRNGTRTDVYQYDVAEGSLHLLSSGESTSDSLFVDATADGSDVFIATRERLSAWDTDDNYDIYDVRVGGGVPDQPAKPVACSGEACQGRLSLAPPGLFPSSSELVRESASAKTKRAATRCGRGKVRRTVRGTVRCVKKSRLVRCKRGEVRRSVRGRARCVRARHSAGCLRRARRRHERPSARCLRQVRTLRAQRMHRSKRGSR